MAIVVGASLPPQDARAQYFGRNKVLWEDFDFSVLETAHFEIYYYPRDSESAEYVARLAERWYERLSRAFRHEFEEKKPLIIYQDHADFQQTVVTPNIIGEGTGGFTESRQDRIVLPLTGINADNDHVIGHELVHAFQFDMAARSTREGQRINVNGLPLWAVEGLAEYFSQGRVDPVTALHMRDAVLYENLPDMDAFIRRQLSPYQYGQAIWAYVAGHYGDEVVRQLFVAAGTSGTERAFEAVLGIESQQFWRDFHEDLKSAYAPILDERVAPEDAGALLLGLPTTQASINISPSLSPDGRWIAFLSTRELAIELYLADARTGEVVRKLVSADADPHFDNLSFLDSSAAWSPDSRRLAISVYAEGDRRLAIYDIGQKQVVRVLDPPGINGMRHPTWSPDARSLVFSAVENGVSDLYRIEIEPGDLQRLTDDPYTAIQPTFSRDGRSIVFVTDRGPATNVDTLEFGPLKLARLDLETGSIELLPLFDRGKHTDPNFAPAGDALYFVAEPDGVPNVYRYDFGGNPPRRITNLKTGVTGITATSPALSVSAMGDLAFSVLADGDFSIFRLDPESASAAAATTSPSFAAAVLPPADGAAGLVAEYLENPRLGLVDAARNYPVEDYDARLRFQNLGPGVIGVGTGRDGTDFASALSAYFNDPLNRHQLSVTVEGGSTQGDLLGFEDTIGVGTTYLNQSHRIQWGAYAARTPSLRTAAGITRTTVEIDGMTVPADVVERVAEVVTVEEGVLFAQYPLSTNNRFELEAGVSDIDFERRAEQLIFPDEFSPRRREFELPAPMSLDLRRGAAVFVRDTSRFGIASPVDGARFRAETSWTRGDLSFRTTTLDYRRYFFKRPFTFALRALHVGRRGADAEDPRLPPLDIGRSTLVRGYELGSIDLSECTVPAGDGLRECPEVERLVGSRIGVVNFEFRLPLFGTEDFGLFELPAMPTELAVFVDIGAAWSSGQSVELEFERDTTRRVPVVSTGIALRTVLLGALPIEFYYAMPAQRPSEDAVFGFAINVGW